MDDQKITVTMEQVKDFEFRVNFGSEIQELIVDETPPLGGSKGPTPSRVLAAAVGSCLSASLLFCLQKARVQPKNIRTVVSYSVQRNAAGRLRVPEQHVSITLDMDVPEDAKSRAGRCLELFEDFCTVTQSVRQGILVHVDVKNAKGEEIYRSALPPL
jgi:uncharacterized OsmC-like protein